MFESLYFFLILSTFKFDCYESKALFLTPLIERGEIKAAQRQAEVKPFLPHVKSFSGYLTVDKKHNSNLFFWFFPTSSTKTDVPLILWLQGGPGTSSLFGLFQENGPYIFKKGKLRRRELSWTNFYNLLYVDAPTGTGFSFTNSSDGCSTNCAEGSDHLFEVLRQFLLLFPGMQKNKLILSGESYGAKYLTSLAHTILSKNSTKPKINVWKIFLTSAVISMEDVIPHYNSYLGAHGLLDKQGEDLISKQQELVVSLIRAKEYIKAKNIFLDVFTSSSGLLRNLTGIHNIYNFMKESQSTLEYFVEFMNQKETKAALHVDDMKFMPTNKSIVMKQKDLLKSIKNEFGIVLENFKTLVCLGQFDIITSYYPYMKLIESTDWSGNWNYIQAQHQPLKWKRHLCGFYKVAKKYTEVMLRNSGHFIGEDQPRCLLEVLRAFVNGVFDKEM